MASGTELGGRANSRAAASNSAPCQKFVSGPPSSTTSRSASRLASTQCSGHMIGASAIGSAPRSAAASSGTKTRSLTARVWSTSCTPSGSSRGAGTPGGAGPQPGPVDRVLAAGQLHLAYRRPASDGDQVQLARPPLRRGGPPAGRDQQQVAQPRAGRAEHGQDQYGGGGREPDPDVQRVGPPGRVEEPGDDPADRDAADQRPRPVHPQMPAQPLAGGHRVVPSRGCAVGHPSAP